MSTVRQKCPDCPEMVDHDPQSGLDFDPQRDTVKHPKALHICGGSVESFRRKAQQASPKTAHAAAKILADCITGLQKLGRASNVSAQKDLIPVLATDMARKAGKGESADVYLSAAEGQIKGNNTTALTTSDDRYTGIEGGAKFDELHELVHICSGVGGESELHKWKLQMNEGAINYFSELACGLVGVTKVDRYTDETVVCKLLLGLFANSDLAADKLYGMTFRGDITGFFLALGHEFNKAKAWPSGRALGFSEKNKSDSEIGDMVKAKVKNWDKKWIEERFKRA
jgi:hypothetical protein